MRERKLILDGSACQNNFNADGPKTVEESKRLGKQPCPNFERCNNGALHPVSGHQCAMMFGLTVAQYVVQKRTTVGVEMQDYRRAGFRPKLGFFWSDDRETIGTITDVREAEAKIRSFAEQILGGPDGSKVVDERLEVGPTLNDVVAHAMTPTGAIDLAKMQELEGRYGSNGGRGCDVARGPCSCGAWH